MNSESLSIEHGGPLRLVIPGVIGARWTKWLARVIISTEEVRMPNYYGDQRKMTHVFPVRK